jgi:hypothetical protein
MHQPRHISGRHSEFRRRRRLLNRWNLLAAALGAGALAVVVFPSDTNGSTARTLRTAAVTEPTAPSAKDVRGASPYFEVENEADPKLFVDPPLPEGLAEGIVWIQWRVENLHVVPVFGKGASSVSPRVGHLHVSVDDLPWWWADPGDINTIDIAGLPVGPHKVRIDLVNPEHEVFPGQSKTVTFTIPKQVTR